MTTPKPYTAKEVRLAFMEHVRDLARYWAELPNKTPQERCDGLAFSILNIFDGTSADLPAMNIVLAPHPDDREYHIENGERWYEAGMVINDDCMLHEFYHRKEK